ncbi:LOW QUALITY PROTEIN: hypothetical protein TorRG33x02_101500 [Trema orientale]|uniref:Uncharacterized protein n=1 Tax=Trema orientale TaxID=63057 RepID=A0A2P5F8J2_TREOI|nr:LOW QUALITY PROTEIN: hypothetical protein TorRG33x02_101500 [Trema orientale]
MITSYQVQRDAMIGCGSSSFIKVELTWDLSDALQRRVKIQSNTLGNRRLALFDPKMDEVNPVRSWKKLRNGLICGGVAKGSWPATFSKPFSKLFPPRIGLVSIPARAPAPLQLCG